MSCTGTSRGLDIGYAQGTMYGHAKVRVSQFVSGVRVGGGDAAAAAAAGLGTGGLVCSV